MNWQAIGALGDALGGVGVILTLIYLTFQIRLNTRAIRSSNRYAWLNAILQHDALLAQYSSLVHRMVARERLVGEDESLMSAILWSLLNPLEMLYFELREGNVDEAYFAARLNGLAIWLEVPSARAVFDAYRSTLDARFVDRVERFMRERQSAP